MGGVGRKELGGAQRVESSELRERQGRRSQVMTGIQVREGLWVPAGTCGFTRFGSGTPLRIFSGVFFFFLSLSIYFY